MGCEPVIVVGRQRIEQVILMRTCGRSASYSRRALRPQGRRFLAGETLGSPCSTRNGRQRNPTLAPKTEASRVGAEPPDIQLLEPIRRQR